MNLRELSESEAIERAPSIARRQLLGGAVALAFSGVLPGASSQPAAGKEAFTLADLIGAERMLRANNVPPYSDGTYVVYLHPANAERVKLDALLSRQPYRARVTGWAIYEHEERRRLLGKRGLVTAEEVASRLAHVELAIPFAEG